MWSLSLTSKFLSLFLLATVAVASWIHLDVKYEIMHLRKLRRKQNLQMGSSQKNERVVILVIIYTCCWCGIYVGFKYGGCSACEWSCEQFCWRCGTCARDATIWKSHRDATILDGALECKYTIHLKLPLPDLLSF